MDESFEIEIPRLLQQGKIVIVDLSQGEPVVQRLFSEKICRSTFNISMDRFINNLPNNFIQFYFEEAHNLFLKKMIKILVRYITELLKKELSYI